MSYYFNQIQQPASVDSIASQQSGENPMNNMIISRYIVENDPYNQIRRDNQKNNYTGYGNININNVSNLHVIDATFDQQPQPLHGRTALETNDTQTTSFDGDADVGGMALLTLNNMPHMKNINNVHSISSSNNNDLLMANHIMIGAQSRSSSSSSSRVANIIKHNLKSNVSIDTVVGAENLHRSSLIDSNAARRCEIVTNAKYVNGHTKTQEIQVQTVDGFMDNNDKNHSSRFDTFCDTTSWCSCCIGFCACFSCIRYIFDCNFEIFLLGLKRFLTYCCNIRCNQFGCMITNIYWKRFKYQRFM